jgi:hypothetical protein
MTESEVGVYPDPALPGPGVVKPFDFPLPDDDDVWEAGETPRRIGGSRHHSPPVRRASARDREKPPQEPRIDLVLYTSPESERSQRAVRAVHQVLKRYDERQIRFTTCDLSQRPQDGDADSVVFTPTLVKQGPGPKTAIIGNLEREEVLLDLLDASGVDRRWDD